MRYSVSINHQWTPTAINAMNTNNTAEGQRKAKHTPGPWRQNDHPQRGNQLYVRIGSGCANAIVERKDTFGKVSDEDIANARLIAAAPDLLEACRQMLFDVFEDVHPETVKQARAAIAKAEGAAQ